MKAISLTYFFKCSLLTLCVLSLNSIYSQTGVGFSTATNFDYKNINTNSLLIQSSILPTTYNGIDLSPTLYPHKRLAMSYYLSVIDLAQRIDQAFHFNIPFDQQITIKNSSNAITFLLRKVKYSNDGLRMVFIRPSQGLQTKRCIFLTNGNESSIGNTAESLLAADLLYRGYAIAFYENAGASAATLDNDAAYINAYNSGLLNPSLSFSQTNYSLKSPFLGIKYATKVSCSSCKTAPQSLTRLKYNGSNNVITPGAGETITYVPVTMLKNTDYTKYLYNSSGCNVEFGDGPLKSLASFYSSYIASRTAYFYLKQNANTFFIDVNNIYGCGGSLGSITSMMTQYLDINNSVNISNIFYDNIFDAYFKILGYNLSIEFAATKYPATFYNTISLKALYVQGSGIFREDTQLGPILDGSSDANKPMFIGSGSADILTPPISSNILYSGGIDGPLIYKDRLNSSGSKYNIYNNCIGGHTFNTPINIAKSGVLKMNIRNSIQISGITTNTTLQNAYLNMNTINEVVSSTNITNFLDGNNIAPFTLYCFMHSILQTAEINNKAANFLFNVTANSTITNTVNYLSLNMIKNTDAEYYLNPSNTVCVPIINCYPTTSICTNTTSCLGLKYINGNNTSGFTTDEKNKLFNTFNTTTPYTLQNPQAECAVLPAALVFDGQTDSILYSIFFGTDNTMSNLKSNNDVESRKSHYREDETLVIEYKNNYIMINGKSEEKMRFIISNLLGQCLKIGSLGSEEERITLMMYVK